MSTTTKQTNVAKQADGINVTDLVRTIIAPLASLKLTVFLLVLGIIVVFIATLDQTRHDVFHVKMKHFESAFVAVPFQTFFVPRWFPDRQDIPGSFYIPSGLTVLVLMLLNLSAAHALRFKLQARGVRLIGGLFAVLVAGFASWAVIFNGQSPSGFQAAPPIPFKQMWMLMQVGMLAMAICSLVAFFIMDKGKTAERILLGCAATTFAIILGVTIYLGSDAFIGDSAMRILWQLAQSTVAALIAYVACVLLFNRKAGIVLLHLGIGGLMLNEIYVTVTNDEQRMTIVEGETAAYAIDVRATEMAIIDVSDPEFDQITSIPGVKLIPKTKTASGDIAPPPMITDESLPFNIQCIEYLPNSDIRRVTSPAKNLATAGVGQRFEAYPIPTTAGTDSEQTVDFASAYVKLTSKSDGDSLGTYLITQNIAEGQSDKITVDGNSYRIALRFETEYKPYSLKLIDAQRENYIGTDTPKWYSSDVVLNDFSNDVSSEQKIWMNNPLRYSDETFYQSGMHTMSDGRDVTVLQVVTNKGWMIPYVCCMFTVVGLLAQFGSSLLAFLEKNRKQMMGPRSEPVAMAQLADESVKPTKPLKTDRDFATPQFDLASRTVNKPNWALTWIPAIVLSIIFVGWVMGQVASSSLGKVEHNEMRMDLLGQIPVAMNGRVQPLDSFARNTARQLTKREVVIDENEAKQPAIVWLADTVFEREGFMDYRLFRIEDLNILNALELPHAFEGKRGKFRYTLGEMLEAERTLRELIPNPEEKDPKSWSQFQKRLKSVADKIQRVYGAKLAFGGPDRSEEDLTIRIDDASKEISSPLIPLVVPTEDEDKPWKSFLGLQNKAFLADLAKEFDCETTAELAIAIVKREEAVPDLDTVIRKRIIQRFLSDPGFLKIMEEQHQEKDPRVLAQLLEDNWDEFPESIKNEMVTREKPLAEAMVAQMETQFQTAMEDRLALINGSAGKIVTENSELASLLFELKPAYLAGDATKFNSTLESYHAKLAANPPIGMDARKMKTELFYNNFSPFFLAMVIYLVAAVFSTFGWIGLNRSFIRATSCLLLIALAVQISGIVMRVTISGRPPVTNLYSSALFVSAAMVLLMLVVELFTRIGIGNLMAGLGGFLALMWAWTMTIVDGDTFTVMVAVLDTQFWLATHVVIISIGYAATFGAGFLGVGYLLGSLLSPAFKDKNIRRLFGNMIYGVVCFGLLCSFFGTVLGGLWGDDSWGRFWGWDPKENGALMIVLWNAVVLHARWGGIVRERGMAALAVLGNVVVLWSWKGVNALGVGLHAYAGTEDDTVVKMLMLGVAHVAIACVVFIPSVLWMSYRKEELAKKLRSRG